MVLLLQGMAADLALPDNILLKIILHNSQEEEEITVARMETALEASPGRGSREPLGASGHPEPAAASME